MPEIIPHFTTMMSWIIFGLCSMAVVLLGLEVWHSQQDRRRALLGLMGMVLVLVAAATSLFALAAHQSSHHPLLSQLLLPLAVPVLLMSFSQWSFSPCAADHRFRLSRFFFLLLSGGAILSAGGLVVLDLLFS